MGTLIRQGEEPSELGHLYRYEIFKGSIANDVVLRQFPIIGKTDKGYWIRIHNEIADKKWVSSSAKKRYAYDTLEGAQVNFRRRTQIRIEILTTQLRNVEDGLKYFEKMLSDKNNSLSL